jgi:serine/threonine-protein kinase
VLALRRDRIEAMPADPVRRSAPRQVGRYTLFAEIASGGMATVYFGQMVGAHGFSRVVAIKRMLPRLARDPSFHAMFVDEARLASRVQHPNVVPILDVLDEGGEVMIVMDYVRGPSLSTLLKTMVEKGEKAPVPVIASIVCGMLAGLHAAHEAKDRQGRTLGIVHRDVSPQNVLVGVDGVSRLMDFGVAKATNRLAQTQEQQLKGKLAYMAPEQLQGGGVDRRTDVFAAAVVLWGALAGRRLFRGSDVTETMSEVLRGEIPSLSLFRDDVPPALEAAMRRALERDREARQATAEELAEAIERACPLASPRAVAEWVTDLTGSIVAERDAMIVEIEHTTTHSLPGDSTSFTPEIASSADASKALTREWSRESRTDDAAAGKVWVIAAAVGAAVAVGLGLFAAASRTGASQSATSTTEPSSTTSPVSAPSASTSPSAEAAPAPSASAEPSASTEPSVRVPVRPAGPKPQPVATPPTSKPSSQGPRGPYYPPSPFPR